MACMDVPMNTLPHSLNGARQVNFLLRSISVTAA